MRDHPAHNWLIMAGMFGTNWMQLINLYQPNNDYFYDQEFLRDFIYPKIMNSLLVHASFYKYETFSKNFPILYEKNYRFVGEYIDENENYNESHRSDLKSYYSETIDIFEIIKVHK